MKITVNAVASYRPDQAIFQDDLDAIKEDIEDCLRWTGPVLGASGIVVEVKVEP